MVRGSDASAGAAVAGAGADFARAFAHALRRHVWGSKFQSIALANAAIAGQEGAPGLLTGCGLIWLRETALSLGVRLRRSAADADGSAGEETVVGIDAGSGRIFCGPDAFGASGLVSGFSYAGLCSAEGIRQAESTTIEIVVDQEFTIEVFAENVARRC